MPGLLGRFLYLRACNQGRSHLERLQLLQSKFIRFSGSATEIYTESSFSSMFLSCESPILRWSVSCCIASHASQFQVPVDQLLACLWQCIAEMWFFPLQFFPQRRFFSERFFHGHASHMS